MKKLILIGIVITLFSSCAALQKAAYYSNLAKEHSFEYYFPVASGTNTYANLEEAYDFVRAAHEKLVSSINMHRFAKGLAAKLIGPVVKSDKPVVVAYFLMARSSGAIIDLSRTTDTLKSMLRDAIAVTSVFLVFSEDCGVSITDFYLAESWEYNSNSQPQKFFYNYNIYETDYPVGWGIDKAFAYLKKAEGRDAE